MLRNLLPGPLASLLAPPRPWNPEPGNPFSKRKPGGLEGLVTDIGPATVIGAVVYAAEKLKEQIVNTVSAMKGLALAFVNPDANPAAMVQSMGGFVSKLTEAIPIVGQFGGMLGGALNALGEFMNALDGIVNRYAQYSPQLAAAQAQAEVTQTLNDIRRAQEVTPALLRYINSRTELQQKFEDAKIKFINAATPLITLLMESLGNLFENVGNLGSAMGAVGTAATRQLPIGIQYLHAILTFMENQNQEGDFQPLDELFRSVDGNLGGVG